MQPSKKPHIFIATPTSGGSVKTDYVTSLMGMVSRLHAKGVRTTYANVDAADVSEQRDALAHECLKHAAITHLLFVDGDMRFPSGLCGTLLSFDLPFVGTVYARRKLSLEAIEQHLKTVSSLRDAEALAYEFNVRPQRSSVMISQGLCEVEGFGLGFALIRRDCLTTLAESGTVPIYPSRYVNDDVHRFFGRLQLADGSLLSEDYSFCRRWRQCGGQVFAYAMAEIEHVGDFRYGVPFIERLRAGSSG
jgi:hypothetical protein